MLCGWGDWNELLWNDQGSFGGVNPVPALSGTATAVVDSLWGTSSTTLPDPTRGTTAVVDSLWGTATTTLPDPTRGTVTSGEPDSDWSTSNPYNGG